MDKTIEIVLVATVIIMTGAAVMFLFSGEAGHFDDVMGDQGDSAQCDLYKTQYKNADCDPSQVSMDQPSDCNNLPTCS
jgi:hypothetical protein